MGYGAFYVICLRVSSQYVTPLFYRVEKPSTVNRVYCATKTLSIDAILVRGL